MRNRLYPEVADGVRRLDADDHVPCNRTCEIALTRAMDRQYRHIIELVERTR